MCMLNPILKVISVESFDLEAQTAELEFSDLNGFKVKGCFDLKVIKGINFIAEEEQCALKIHKKRFLLEDIALEADEDDPLIKVIETTSNRIIFYIPLETLTLNYEKKSTHVDKLDVDSVVAAQPHGNQFKRNMIIVGVLLLMALLASWGLVGLMANGAFGIIVATKVSSALLALGGNGLVSFFTFDLALNISLFTIGTSVISGFFLGLLSMMNPFSIKQVFGCCSKVGKTKTITQENLPMLDHSSEQTLDEEMGLPQSKIIPDLDEPYWPKPPISSQSFLIARFKSLFKRITRTFNSSPPSVSLY